MGSQHKESSPLKNKPEVRDEISTPTFEYEITYYTKDHSLIYQFKVKEDSKKQNKETEQKKRINEHDERNEPLDLSMKSPSTLNATQISTQGTYSPVSYTMDYVQLEERNNKQKQHKKSHNQMPMIGRGK